MAYAQELKNLVAEIKTGHKDRTARIGEIKRETHNILGEADDFMKRVAAELKEMARDLKSFLAKSEELRKGDFEAMIGEIRATIKEIKGDVKNFLAKSEEKRLADFKATMKDVTETLAVLRRQVKGVLGECKAMIADYKAERKEAAGYWASLYRKGAAPAEVAAPKAEKKKKGKK